MSEMTKITEESTIAFLEDTYFSSGNTRVSDGYLAIRGNDIAKKVNGDVFISNAGWETQTTKARLNGILEYLGTGKIKQIKGVWYLINQGVKTLFPKNEWIKAH